MISILKRILIPIPISLQPTVTTTSLPAKLMDSANSQSQRLITLAHQLRPYKPLLMPLDDDSEDPTIEDRTSKVVSQVGVVESTAPIAKDPKRFRPKRVVVLICLFEGVARDLCVILMKRSLTLSTHSSEIVLPGGKAEEGDADDGDMATR